MRYQSNTLRPATVQILEGVLYSSSDEVVAELAPVLARRCGTNPALLGRLITREAAWPAAGEYAARLERESALSALDAHPRLPAAVLEVLFEKYGRSSSAAYIFARRTDLPLSIARRIAPRQHRSVRHAVWQNQAFPTAALWSQLRQQGEAGEGTGEEAPLSARYTTRSAWQVCHNMLRRALDPEAAEYRRTKHTTLAIRAMPGARPSQEIEERFIEAARRNLVTSEALAGWLLRGVESDGIAWFLEMIEKGEELGGALHSPSGDVLAALCRYHTTTRSYHWTDTPNAARAVRSSSQQLRAAAWTHPANAAAIEAMRDELGGVSRSELRGMAQNTAVDAATAKEIVAALGDEAWLAHRLPALTETERLAMLSGAGGRSMSSVLSEALTGSVQPAWLPLWMSPAVFAAAIKAAGATTPGSVLLEAAVTRWPEHLESFVENVKLGHMMGNAVTAAVLGRVEAMEVEAAKVVAGLIDEWDEPIAALVRAAQSI